MINKEMLAAYKIQNPEKYAQKKEALEAKLGITAEEAPKEAVKVKIEAGNQKGIVETIKNVIKN